MGSNFVTKPGRLDDLSFAAETKHPSFKLGANASADG
jgi:hypothetical protein